MELGIEGGENLGVSTSTHRPRHPRVRNIGNVIACIYIDRTLDKFVVNYYSWGKNPASRPERGIMRYVKS
jgi:hypothetical protein